MRTAECSPPWRVLLIGGNSGAGKTAVWRRLATRFGVALAEVDDFRLVPERMTTPEQQPELHSLLALFDIESQPWSPPGAVCDALIKVAHIMSYALEIVVANHVATDTPTIIEGDRIVPAFAAQRVFANRDSGARFGQCSSSKRTETDWRETRRREDAPLSHCQHTTKNSTFV